jgi:predicted transcriptional regulator
MNEIANEEALRHLRQAGWASEEIARLCRVRQAYLAQQRRGCPDRRRSLLLRWLEQLGKLLQEGTPSLPWW